MTTKPHRHKWDAIPEFNTLTGVRKCVICGERQVKVKGRWTKR